MDAAVDEPLVVGRPGRREEVGGAIDTEGEEERVPSAVEEAGTAAGSTEG